MEKKPGQAPGFQPKFIGTRWKYDEATAVYFRKQEKAAKKIFIQSHFLDTGFLTSLYLFLPIKFLKSNR